MNEMIIISSGKLRKPQSILFDASIESEPFYEVPKSSVEIPEVLEETIPPIEKPFPSYVYKVAGAITFTSNRSKEYTYFSTVTTDSEFDEIPYKIHHRTAKRRIPKCRGGMR